MSESFADINFEQSRNGTYFGAQHGNMLSWRTNFPFHHAYISVGNSDILVSVHTPTFQSPVEFDIIQTSDLIVLQNALKYANFPITVLLAKPGCFLAEIRAQQAVASSLTPLSIHQIIQAEMQAKIGKLNKRASKRERDVSLLKQDLQMAEVVNEKLIDQLRQAITSRVYAQANITELQESMGREVGSSCKDLNEYSCGTAY
jgi:hypothetical protein